MNILLYDDHNFVTEAVAQYLSRYPDIRIVAQCHNVADVIHNLKINEVDLLVSDVLSDEDAGFTIFNHTTQNYPKTKVVIYSSITNDFIIQSLLDMGISAVINKKVSIAILWEQIQKILLEGKTKTKKETTILKLTKREKEIASFLARGLSAKEIAESIGSSQNTINNQKNAMLEKFDCMNSTELVVKLTQMGLIGII